MNKIIVIDGGSFTHFAIFGWESQYRKKIEDYSQKNQVSFIEAKEVIDELLNSRQLYISQPNYLYFQSLIGILKRVGVNKENTIIIAQDKTISWRKIFAPYYKAQRKEFREGYDLINWKEKYSQIDRLMQQIDEATDWHIVWLPHVFNYLDILPTEEGQKLLNIDDIKDINFEFGVEGDDIMAVAPKFFSNKECVLITKDADLDMLTVRPNVKIFSMNTKWKGGTGVYKPVENGYKILEKKIRCGDVSDNIIVDKENDTERDKEIRKLIIDLINLPDWVTKPIEDILGNLPKKETDFSLLPFQNSLAQRFPQIYSTEKIITYEDCLKRLERKKVRVKNKKKKMKKSSTMRKMK